MLRELDQVGGSSTNPTKVVRPFITVIPSVEGL